MPGSVIKIQPLVIVSIHTTSRMKELGIADHPDFKKNGIDAKKYSAFIYDELYFFIKKKTLDVCIRKFTARLICLMSFAVILFSKLNIIFLACVYPEICLL